MNKVNGIVDTEDRFLVRESVVLKNLLIMIEKSGAELKTMGTLLERAYAMAQRIIEDRVLEDSKANRAALKAREIKLHDEEHNDLVIYYHFTCRGYNEKFGMTRDVLKSEISVRLGKYTSEIGAVFNNARQKTT